jgi:hypothetical protein
VLELGRVLTYLGVFVLAFAVQDREGLRRTVGSAGAAIAVLGLIALLSRLHPGWFDQASFGPGDLAVAQPRLNYPLNYWNGLAALIAVGIPLMLTMALRGRTIAGQALAAAAVPMMALTAFYTLSRGGAIEVAVAVAVLILIYPRRLEAAPTLFLTAAGSAILIVAATQRDELADGLLTEVADAQRDQMLGLVLAICIGVGLLQCALALSRRHGVLPRIEVTPRATAASAVLGALIALVIAVGAGVPGELSDRWDEFKRPSGPDAVQGVARFESSTGSGRYQTWQSAIDANETEPLTGIGPGTFEFWWAREGSIPTFVRDAHSLYLETLGELGIVGLLLIASLVAAVLILGVRRALRASEEKRALLAGATAACAAFAIAAAIDWVWELAVLPCVFLLLAAAIAGPQVVRRRIARRSPSSASGAVRSRDRDPQRWHSRVPWARLGIGAVSVVAIVAVAIPYSAANSISASRDLARASDLAGALAEVDTADNLQPYAASPKLQRALLLESSGDLTGAAAAAAAAAEDEATNWRTWFVLSRIEAYRGRARASVDAYLQARELNPRSLLFARPQAP